MYKTAYKRPLIPVLIAFITGLYTSIEVSGFLNPVLVSGSISLFIVIVAAIYKKNLILVPFFLFFSTGYALMHPFTEVKLPGNHVSTYADSGKYLIKGIVAQRPVRKNRKLRIILDASTLENKSVSIPVTGKLRVNIYGSAPDIKAGTELLFKSSIRRFRNFSNPDGFDYVRYMGFKDIWANAYTTAKTVTVINKSSASPVAAIQNSVINLIDNAVSDKDVRGVLKALIIGDKQWIAPELTDAFSKTGTRHLLAISGLHIGIVAGVAFWVFCFALSYIPPVIWRGRVFCYAGFLTLFPVCAYGIIAGMSPSTQRAVIMIAVLLLSFSVRADHDILNTLTLAALTILIISPVSLFSISFQLSFSAVFAIAAGIPILNLKSFKERDRLTDKLKHLVFSYFFVSLLAFIGTLPLVLHYFNQISIVGIFANIILVPLVGFLVVPTALLAVILLPISSHISTILIKLAGFALEIALIIIKLISNLPFASLKTITPSHIEIILYYIIVLLILYFFYAVKKTGWKRKTGIIILISLMITADVSYWINKRFFDENISITIIDVGQGSAALLSFPGGETMLIDGGGFSDNTSFDIGEKIIAPFLWRKKIGTIDTIVLTHPESDHLNGLLYILDNFNVKNIWSNGQNRSTAGYKECQRLIDKHDIRHQLHSSLPKTIAKNNVALKILYPPTDFIKKMDTEKWRSTNNNSLVLRVEYENISILFPGDIMKKAEEELIHIAGESLKSTILIAPHHGSRTSSTDNFINRVNPEHIIISAGWKNRYKMPHKSVLKRFRKTGAHIYRTDHQGAVSITATKETLTVHPFRSE